MFNVVVKSDSVMALLDTISPHVHDALLPAITRDAALILGQARALASGDVLQERTGKYVKSIKSKVYDSNKRVYAKVYSRDPRAGLFEWGGSTPARDILPNTAQVMKFMGTAGEVFAKIVHRPVVQYPPHPVINAAFDELKSDVQMDIEKAGWAAALDIV
jgi:hypothetical protein